MYYNVYHINGLNMGKRRTDVHHFCPTLNVLADDKKRKTSAVNKELRNH